MAKIISLASSKAKPIQNGWEINNPAHTEALLADTASIIGGPAKGQNVFVNDGVRYYVAYITGEDNFANLPKVFEVTPLTAPVLSSPADNASNQELNVSLSWGSVSGALRYDLEIIPKDKEPVIISKTGTSHTMTGATYSTDYEWRVRAIGNKIPGTWSAKRKFTTKADPA